MPGVERPGEKQAGLADDHETPQGGEPTGPVQQNYLAEHPVNKAWIRCVDDALVRADSVVTLRNCVNGLTAETLTGSVVQLTRTDCPSTVQLALLEEIRSAESADDRFAKVIVAVEGQTGWRGLMSLSIPSST